MVAEAGTPNTYEQTNPNTEHTRLTTIDMIIIGFNLPVNTSAIICGIDSNDISNIIPIRRTVNTTHIAIATVIMVFINATG